jgi:hypothetical protein
VRKFLIIKFILATQAPTYILKHAQLFGALPHEIANLLARELLDVGQVGEVPIANGDLS